MANEFVRKIRKTDVTKEPLSTNTEGDIILDHDKGAYIRYKDEYRKISGISNLTFNTEHVTLANTARDGTKRIELSEDLLNKINNPIQAGITTIAVKGNEWNEISVTFKHPFSSTPCIVATNSQSTLENLNIQTSNITTKGFTLKVFSTKAGTSTGFINWIAVPRT